MSPDDPRHGTAGYAAHRRAGETACAACKAGHAAATLELRRVNGNRREVRQAMLRGRALSRLAKLHPDDYARLYSEVCREAAES